jgi:diadenosine tetraphosphate (Ap4A) HIT family hydrolase
VRELFELDSDTRHAFIDEVTQVASALERAFQPRKLNVEMLGNQVPHLHCHIFPRSAGDPDHLKPVWVAIDLADRHLDVRQQLAGRNVDRAALKEKIRAELSKLRQ